MQISQKFQLRFIIKLDQSKDVITFLNQMIEIYASTEKILEQEKKLFDKIIQHELYGSRKQIAKLLKQNLNNFVAKLVECVIILKNEEDEFEQRLWLFKYIDDILNFIENEQEKSIFLNLFMKICQEKDFQL